MKSKISIIIAAFAILISFAFITVNKNSTDNSKTMSIHKVQHEEPLSVKAMDDQDQWN